MPSELAQFHARLGPHGWREPLDVYRSLRDRGALLLDGVGAHPEARHAIIALSPRLEARLGGDRLSIRHGDGRDEVRAGDPKAMLRALLGEWRFQVQDSPSPFTGGFVGYLGYEAARIFEPTLPLPKADPGTPDAVLRLCRDAIAFDRRENTVTVWTTDLPGESEAEERLHAWVRAVAAVASSGSLSGVLSGSSPGSPSGAPPPTAPETVSAVWTPSMDAAAFTAAVAHLREQICTGDLFQANLATRFSTPLQADPVALFAAMQAHNPSPFMALLEWDDHAIISNSPEQLFAVEGGVLRARPIAGTRPRGRDDEEDRALEQELLADPKEQAEHTMLVDLLRNDVARVSQPGTVRVPERMSVERYRHVMHLVSRVEGKVRPGTDVVDWLGALFPGGTITGAPKHRACLRIHEAEPVPRGPYTGSAGFVTWDHDTHWNILIRTLVLRDGQAYVHAGSGIVMDSDPEREWQEAGHKAASLLAAATGQRSGGNPTRLGEVTQHGSWSPPAPPGQVAARVLIIDNYDSFVWNLADYCAALGATVEVVRNDEDWLGAMAAFGPTHIILGPGPGWPGESGATWQIASRRDLQLPILGICLGHQALAEASGARVVVHSDVVHGKASPIHHNGVGVLADLPSPLGGARYHSLVVDEATLPPEWQVTARLEDGTVMALEHRERPWTGLQFHPESLSTDRGLETLFRFLKTRPR